MSCTQIKNSKVDPVHATKAYRDSRGITPFIPKILARSLYFRDRIKLLIKLKAVEAPEKEWTFGRKANPLTPVGN
jgi:hypothetical protein